MSSKVAIIVDAGFLKKKLTKSLGYFPKANDVVGHCQALLKSPQFEGHELFRIYYYDCLPAKGMLINPIDKKKTDLTGSKIATDNRSLIDTLKLTEDFAVRLGELSVHGWKIKPAVLKKNHSNFQLSSSFLVPHIEQKGVDIKIGLDVALLAVKKLVEKVILITGDSDFIPVMKFARRNNGVKS